MADQEEEDDLSMYKPPKQPSFNEIEIKNSKSGKFVTPGNGQNPSGGFFVRDAPWDKQQSAGAAAGQNRPDTNDVEEFPSMANSKNGSAKHAVWVSK